MKEKEINAGYEIIERFPVGEQGFAIGHSDTAPAPYVTWQYRTADPMHFFWGHYAGFKEDIAPYEQHKPEDFPGMELCGTTYAEKKDAGAALIETCKAQTNPAAREVGSFRGFTLLLSYDTFSKVFKLTLKGTLSHTIDLGSDIHGNIQRIENAFEMLPTRLAACEQALANLHTQIENAKAEVEKPFAQEEELKTKSARLAELDSMLNMDKRENDTLDAEPEQEEGKERVRSFDRER